MRTLGIDLASADERTGGCMVDWTDRAGRIVVLMQPFDDAAIIELAREADAVAIDAPLGWPSAFVDAVTAHAAGGPWQSAPSLQLRYRATDLAIQRSTGLWPLSVSSDRIAVVAFRAARLASLLRPHDHARDGSNGLLEAYPAAALQRWSLPSRSYKLPEHVAERSRILTGLQQAIELDLAGHADRLIGSSDRLDALVSAMVARS